ncbi:MAG: hydantoinase B/oxoprolinase family protein [Thermomicrobiales bacterium]|nr:hydantoinase B/oxoprolinase family protein [Thermomicrobiales bacterium]MCO5221558.1 hydantoinase B/oxoprolinase family protein [Thermomicrobiales bacterium]
MTSAVESVAVDPITLEVQWNRLISIMDETDAALVRTSFSSIVGETRDFAVIMLDVHGRSIAQSNFSSPAFTVTLPITTKHFIDVFGYDGIHDGDVLVTNDPWLASGHLPDLTIVTPVFHRGALVAFMACAAHVADIGGTLAWFEARDLFEEGLRIPPSKLYRRGERNEDVFNFLAANVRVPDQVIGDIGAIVSAETVGKRRLIEFLEDYDLPDISGPAAHILDRSEAAMRKAVAEVPDGQWKGEARADGFITPLHIVVTVTKQDQDIWVDFTGSSEQFARGSMNNVLNLTFADTVYSLKCALTPTIPANEGIYRPIHASAPEGSVFNTRFPSAVKARSKTSFHIHNAIYNALAKISPQLVQAGSGSFWSITANGQWSDGSRFNMHLLPNGGKGAVLGMDGLPTIAFPYNGTVTPAEVVENTSPLLFEEKSLLPDSGGAGTYRGGLSQKVVLSSRSASEVIASVRPDKVKFPPPGIHGGDPGALGSVLVNGEPMKPGESVVALEHGDRIEMWLPGGGGVGSPFERPAESVLADVVLGFVTVEAARDRYGVAIDSQRLTIDVDETARLHGLASSGERTNS